MKEKKILSYVVNLIIIFMLTILSLVTFSNKRIDEIDAFSPYYNGNTEQKAVSIMFNVYGGEEYLPLILETLNLYSAKATFFVGGVWAIKHEDALIMLAESGNEIANHGYLHRDHKKLSYTQNKDEILVAERTIENICGIKTNLFAPPSGSFSPETIKACSDIGYKVIMWSKDTIDWRDKDAQLVFSRATKNVKAGDLILMHPTKHTADALDDILKNLKEANFEIKTVGENIKFP